MLSKDDAVQLITSHLDEIYKDFVGGVAIIPEATIEKPYGWVFFHNAKKFIASRQFGDALLGNSPMLVESQSGRITYLGTACGVEESLQKLEASGGLVGQIPAKARATWGG
jgi:hypothetical protein